jgi:hypothetical protein
MSKNMKKRNYLLALVTIVMLCANMHAYAYEPIVMPNTMYPIQFQFSYVDPKIDQKGTHRSPVALPEVWVEDHELYFDTPCDGCTLRVMNEDGEVEYATVIPTDCESLELPSTLEGEYEIQILRGNYCFYGMIEL